MSKQYYDQWGEVRYRSPKSEVGFAQMWHVLTLDTDLADGAYRLYALILKFAQQKGRAWMTVRTLAKGLGKSESVVYRRLRQLVDKGLITREERIGTSPLTWIEEIDEVYQDDLRAYLDAPCQKRHPPLS